MYYLKLCIVKKITKFDKNTEALESSSVPVGYLSGFTSHPSREHFSEPKGKNQKASH